MIEKEAKTADFAKVSAVFHNRLKKGMPLGSDVTVKYVSGSQKMALSDSDLAVDSAYNTYTRTGLPVGPICNPSMDAVVAALYPDEQYVAQKYLYFCSTDPDSGELHFSKTLEEHNAAVAMYRPLWEEYDRSRGLTDEGDAGAARPGGQPEALFDGAALRRGRRLLWGEAIRPARTGGQF